MNAGLASTMMGGTEDEESNEDLLFVGEDGLSGEDADDYLELITAAGRVAGEAQGDLVRARYYIERDEEAPYRSRLIRTGRPFMAPRSTTAFPRVFSTGHGNQRLPHTSLRATP